jgi:hypothetical protein
METTTASETGRAAGTRGATAAAAATATARVSSETRPGSGRKRMESSACRRMIRIAYDDFVTIRAVRRRLAALAPHRNRPFVTFSTRGAPTFCDG